MFQFIPISYNGDEVIQPCARHSNEPVTLTKHITKYKHMRKWMVEFLRKFKNRGIKIIRVYSIRITKSINSLQFCTVLGVRCDANIFKLTTSAYSPLMEKSMVRLNL